jgi:hypothetical protein
MEDKKNTASVKQNGSSAGSPHDLLQLWRIRARGFIIVVSDLLPLLPFQTRKLEGL